MARAKPSKKKPAPKKASKPAAKKPVKAAAKAKSAAKKPAKKGAKKVTKTAKARKVQPIRATEAEILEVEYEDDEDDEDGDDGGSLDEILEVLACPPGTADQLCEVCEEGLESIQRNLPHVAAAELVWRERPERAELAAGITALIEELQRHAQALGDLYDRLYPHAQDDAEHEDLDPAEVLDRIRPLLEHHAKMEGAEHTHDHGPGGHDHDHDRHEHADHEHADRADQGDRAEHGEPPLSDN
jgi:hypothetical protein